MSGGREGVATGETADHLRLLIESQPDYAIFLLDPTGHVVTWNGGARADEGLSRRTRSSAATSRRSIRPSTSHDGLPEQELEDARRTGRYEDGGLAHPQGRLAVLGQRGDHGAARRARRRWSGFGKVTRDLTSRQLAASSCGPRPPSCGPPTPSSSSSACWSRSVRDYAIFMLDATGHIRTWNAGAEHIKGYTADEIIGRHFSLFYTDGGLARATTRRTSSRSRRARAASRRKAGACARTARCSGPTW